MDIQFLLNSCLIPAVYILMSFRIQIVDSQPYYCDCFESDEKYPFNASCLNDCYFNYTATSPCAPPKGSWEEIHQVHEGYVNCAHFLTEYFGIRNVNDPLVGAKSVVVILETPSTTVISLNADMKMRYSMNGLSNYTCKISTFEVTQETDVLKKCYHYSEDCPISPTVFPPTDYGTIGKLATHKDCLISLEKTTGNFSLMNPVSVNIFDPTAVKTECKVGYSSSFNAPMFPMFLDESFVTIEFPLALKSQKIYGGDASTIMDKFNNEFPTPDNDLEVHVTTLTNNIYAVDLTWTCPSNWKGAPDFYRVSCARIPAPTNETSESCKTCWKSQNLIVFSHNTQMKACFSCFDSVANHLETPKNQDGWVDPVAHKPFVPRNFKDQYIGYPVHWHSHISTFIIHDCGSSCDNSTTVEKIISGLPVWYNTNVVELKFMCIVDATNKLVRHKSVRWAWGGVEYLKAVTMTGTIRNMGFGKLGIQTPKKYIQLQYRQNATQGSCGVLLLEVFDDKDFLELKEQKDRSFCQPTIAPDITFIFPPEVQWYHKVNLGSSVGCYDWISQTWYFPIKTHLFKESTEFTDAGTSFVIIPSAYDPMNVHCFPSKSLVLWTSQQISSDDSRNTIETAKVKMESGGLDVKVTMYSKMSDFPGCHSDTNFLSTDIDVHSRPGYLYIIVLTGSGLWNISMETTFCQIVVNSSTILQHVNALSDIQSFSLFSSIKMFFILKSDLGSVYLFNLLSNSWLLIDKYFKPHGVLEPEMLEELPGAPSHSVEIFNLSHAQPIGIKTVSFYNHAREVEEECFFPALSKKHGGKMQFQMLSKTTANVTVYPVFRSSYCDEFRKPPLMYQIRYGIISNGNKSEEHYTTCTLEKCPCDEPTIGPCRIATTIATRQMVISLTVGHLIPDQKYIFEVSAKLKLNPKYLNPISGVQEKYVDYQREFEVNSETKLRSTILGIHVTKYQQPVNFNTLKITAGISVPILVLLAMVIGGLVVKYNKQWYMYKNLNRLRPTDIITIEKLGEGHFGEVWKANLKIKGKLVPAAVKQLNEAAQEKERRQFLEEAILLSKLKHANIIKPLGICMSAKPALLALDFMNGGSLQSFLRRTDVRNQLNSFNLLCISLQVCKACTYLEENCYIHRDISAKNCLISLNQNSLIPKVVKLADFGLAKDISSKSVYTNIHDPVIPVLYTAPEGILKSEFSSKGDVWSFGILLWEIFTWGASPFGKCYTTQGNDQNCSCKAYSIDEMQYFVCLNKKTLNDLPNPCFCFISRKMRDLFDQCWRYKPEERPTFLFLEKYIQALCNKRKQTINLNSPMILETHVKEGSALNYSSMGRLQGAANGLLNRFSDDSDEISAKTSTSELYGLSTNAPRADSHSTVVELEDAYKSTDNFHEKEIK